MLVALLDELLGQTQSPDSRTQTRVEPDIESLSAFYVRQLKCVHVPHSGSCEVARAPSVFRPRNFANLDETLFNETETGTSGGSDHHHRRALRDNAHSRLWIWAFAFRPITQAATRVDEA